MLELAKRAGLAQALILFGVLVVGVWTQRGSGGGAHSVDDLAFAYRERGSDGGESQPLPQLQQPHPRTSTQRRPIKPSRTSTSRTPTKAPISAPVPNQKTSTSKSASGLILTSPLLQQAIQQANLPPFIYAQETLNQTHANMFAHWLDAKSEELFELSMNFSGFKLLNETYNVHLAKEAHHAWINFTEMIMNISNTISEVLNHKTLIVKNLTDLVEKAFDEYRNNPDQIMESTRTLYYDAKSPKTFCDVQDAANLRAAKLNQTLANQTASTSTTTPTATNSSKVKLGFQKKLSSKNPLKFPN